MLTIENQYNFAWKQLVDGKECIVHRKGATPASEGVLGIIPGSMTGQGYIVAGKGNPLSLNSASHGAGRVKSRGECKSTISRSEMFADLENKGVELLGGSVDEAPMAYKDIQKVMRLQEDLVSVLGSFTPKIVRMAKLGGRMKIQLQISSGRGPKECCMAVENVFALMLLEANALEI